MCVSSVLVASLFVHLPRRIRIRASLGMVEAKGTCVARKVVVSLAFLRRRTFFGFAASTGRSCSNSAHGLYLGSVQTTCVRVRLCRGDAASVDASSASATANISMTIPIPRICFSMVIFAVAGDRRCWCAPRRGGRGWGVSTLSCGLCFCRQSREFRRVGIQPMLFVESKRRRQMAMGARGVEEGYRWFRFCVSCLFLSGVVSCVGCSVKYSYFFEIL